MKWILVVSMLAQLLAGLFGYEPPPQLNCRFADREQGAELLVSHREYYSGFTQQDLDYRLQKKGGTLREMYAFAEQQALDFAQAERQAVLDSVERIETILYRKGLRLPGLDEIIFVKTTMAEECYASAYTHNNEIYIGQKVLGVITTRSEQSIQQSFDQLILHELFHCLSRSDPQFRKAMYEIIGFHIREEEFRPGSLTAPFVISNPDVARTDAWATFTIDGEKRDCYMVFAVDAPFEKEGDRFFDQARGWLVPVDAPNVRFSVRATEDYWQKVGLNTQRIMDPEECLADNFALAVLCDREDLRGESLPDPELLDQMRRYLRTET